MSNLYQPGDRISLFQGYSPETYIGSGIFLKYAETHLSYPDVFVMLDHESTERVISNIIGCPMMFAEGKGPGGK